jgi:probable HAF family extracellular repeat protein
MASPNRTKALRRFHLSAVAFTAAMAITAASIAAPPGGSRISERGGATGTETRQVPGFLLEKGRYVTIDVPRRLWEAAPEGIGPIGINDLEQIVGSYEDHSGMVHGFLLDRRRGRFANIDVPGALGTQAEKINNRGQIVGKYAEDEEDVQNNTLRRFLYDRGRFVRIDFPRARQTLAHGINDRGQVVGEYTDADGTIHGFRWDKGRFTTFDGPDGGGAALNEINDRGQMIGVFGDDQTARGFLLSGGVYEIFAAPGFRVTIAYGLNNHAQIVGAAADQPVGGTVAKAFLLARGATGAFTLFNRPGTTATLAFDINNRGQIVGVAGNIPPSAQRGASMMGVTSELQGGQPAWPGSEVDGQDRP